MRIYIRPPTPADTAQFIAAVKASRKLHKPYTAPPDTPEKFAAYLEKAAQPNFCGLLVCLRDDEGVEQFVGGINISNIIRGPLQGAFVGYQAFAGFNGRGLMTTGLNLAVAHAFKALKLHRLEANIQPSNSPSIALAQRCGFKLEGFSPRYLKLRGKWCDHERWAIVRD
jgi:[ribosomal protein S5]-alanine N-acetyltransferase